MAKSTGLHSCKMFWWRINSDKLSFKGIIMRGGQSYFQAHNATDSVHCSQSLQQQRHLNRVTSSQLTTVPKTHRTWLRSAHSCIADRKLAFATHHSLISIVHIKKFHKNWSPKRLAQHLTPWDIILTKGLKKWLQAWHISTSSTTAPHASVMKSKTSRDQDLGDKPPAASLCSVWSLGLRAPTCQPPHGYKPLTNMGFVISQCPLPRAGHDPGIISHEEKRARFRPPASASGTSGKENTYELPLFFSLIFLRGT